MQPNAKTSQRATRGDFLHTFAAPRPRRWLIAALVPVNRVLCLGGVPGLRRVPGLNLVPGIRGLADVVRIDFAPAQRARLLAAVNAETAAFITPNHPEFFTDWMLDKEICTRIALLTANWATHEVVNGMGRIMQRFWLANNLIAQIPGAGSGSAAGKAYSVESAARGRAVLLHPEGQVGWHGDFVAPLYPGVVEMALETVQRLRETAAQREVCIAPVVWKLKFLRDETPALLREMRYVERKLELRVEEQFGLPERVHEAYAMLLKRNADRWDASMSLNEPYWRAQQRVLTRMAQHLHERAAQLGGALPALAAGAQAADYRPLVTHAERFLRTLALPRDEAATQFADLVGDMRRILRVRPEMYPHASFTQEQLAECIKRLRNDYCFGGLRDAVNRFVPRPAGARIAYIGVPEPLNVSHAVRAGTALPETLLAELRARMQSELDRINAALQARGAFVEYANPFAS